MLSFHPPKARLSVRMGSLSRETQPGAGRCNQLPFRLLHPQPLPVSGCSGSVTCPAPFLIWICLAEDIQKPWGGAHLGAAGKERIVGPHPKRALFSRLQELQHLPGKAGSNQHGQSTRLQPALPGTQSTRTTGQEHPPPKGEKEEVKSHLLRLLGVIFEILSL